MLYTKKGDDGKTKTFGCDQRISKSSAIAEALGTLDEINSFLGLCKVESEKECFILPDGTSATKEIHAVQNNLFTIQAELAGSGKSITEDKIEQIEIIIDYIEKELPPIKSFFISGGTKIATYFDVARTISRRAERRVIEVSEEGKVKVSDNTKAYLNRLSSLLYALARLSNHKFGITEESPDYK
jgi:cob(I)alamin adenosyltransferase